MPVCTRAIRVFTTAIIMGLTTFLGCNIPAMAQDIPSENWMGIYRVSDKIGYAHVRMDRETFEGKPGFKCESKLFSRLLALGVMAENESLDTMHLNDKYEPVFEVLEQRSGGALGKIEARFELTQIRATVHSEGTQSTKVIPIPEGSKLIGDPMFLWSTRELKVGDTFDYKWFNAAELTLNDVHTEVLQTDTIEIDGTQFKTLVVRSMTPLGELKCWLDEKGNVLKAAAILGFNMVREPKEKAIKFENSYLPPEDLAVVSSAPADKEILSPRYVKSLKVRLVGLTDKKLAVSDKRQQVKYTAGEKPSADYAITASNFNLDKALDLPIKDKKVAEYLKESAYVQANHAEIKAQAKQIVDGETNAYLAAGMIRAWVNTNMKSKADKGIMRSAVDVLHGKTGVCRDYAVLYTALARSAGIPTKMVSGLVYFEGRFYYHAWAESYVGEWVPFDATLATDFVDATHIKLAEGEATSMFEMVKTMGNLKAEVVEAQ